MQVVRRWTFVEERLTLIGKHVTVVFKRVESITSGGEIFIGPDFKR